ncbi:MAG: type II secretion system GspH family protein, partial [Thermodesulfovibrionales bacterium]|nr:type II secretion system GspH family protein [Thermodesulfovibrionales bacterium]
MCYEKKNLIISFQLFHPFFHKKGFTLIELAIVLVMLGLITALGASLIGPLLKQAKLRESREIVVSAREAVIGYAMQYKMLPDTLSVAGARNVDAWGNSLYYYRDENLKNSNLCITKPAYTISTLNDN